jgi:2'-5' RNA ligase
LLLNNKDSKYLSGIIENLSRKYDAPRFLPHLTLYDSVKIDLPSLKEVVKSSSDGIHPIVVKKSKINESDYIWRTVFIVMKRNPHLTQINKRLIDFLSKYIHYSFKPHMSLIYKKMDRSHRLKIVNQIKIKNEFKFDKIAIVQDSRNVSEWKQIFVRKFS